MNTFLIILGILAGLVDHACGTFSRTDSTVEKVSPEEEAKWVHEYISMLR